MNKKIFLLSLLLICIFIITLHSFSQKSDENAAITLYQDLITNILVKYPEKRYISIDLNDTRDPLNKKFLSNEAKQKILNYLTLYSDNIYEKNEKELLSSELFCDGSTLHGISITITSFSTSNKEAIVYIKYYISEQSSGLISYNIKYTNKKWVVTNTPINVVT